MSLSNFFPVPPPAVSTGLATDAGVAIGKEQYSNAPKVASGPIAPGQAVGVVKEGRIPVVLFTGGFHTP